MSLLVEGQRDKTKYYKPPKDHRIIMKREKFRKQDKTHKCHHSKCPNPGLNPIFIGTKRVLLCNLHYKQYKDGKVLFPVTSFTKASEIG